MALAPDSAMAASAADSVAAAQAVAEKHSLTFAVIFDDENKTVWTDALHANWPFVSLPQLLDGICTLGALTEEVVDLVAIFHLLEAPLFQTALPDDGGFLHALADWMQFPKPTCTKLEQHAAALRVRSKAYTDANDAHGAIMAEIALKPLWDAALQPMRRFSTFCAPDFGGLLGFPDDFLSNWTLSAIAARRIVRGTLDSHCSIAAEYGHLSVLQGLRAQIVPCPWGTYTCVCAARGGHLAVLQWARAQGCPWDEWPCASAAYGGHLVVLQWALAQGCPWDEWTCASAAGNGHLAVLQWALAQGCPWDEWTCTHAAGNGHLAVLQWARAQGCPWDKRTCESAAKNGHLAVLQWARAQGCPWDEWTCAYTAGNGHLAVLQWARAQGCPWDEWTCTYAARNGHLAVLQWARENGCPDV